MSRKGKGFMHMLQVIFGIFGMAGMFGGGSSHNIENPMGSTPKSVGTTRFGVYANIFDYRVKTWGNDYTNNQTKKRQNRNHINYKYGVRRSAETTAS